MLIFSGRTVNGLVDPRIRRASGPEITFEVPTNPATKALRGFS